MIKPYKYMDVNTSVLTITAIILKSLMNNGSITYTNLLEHIEMELGVNVKYNFIYALNLLFLLGKINYNKNGDLVELIK